MYTTAAKLRADGKDGASVWCSLVAFSEQSERLASLKGNQAISISGKAEMSAWTAKIGEPAAGLSLVVDDLAVLKPKPGHPSCNRRTGLTTAGMATVKADVINFPLIHVTVTDGPLRWATRNELA